MSASIYPHVVCATKVDLLKPGSNKRADPDNLFDVKFWPWHDETGPVDQYFAIAGTTQLIICKTRYDQDPPFEILQWIDFRQENYSLNSVAWTKHSVTGKPLLCAAGALPRHIMIIDVETGETIRNLAGHGRSINDLAISPADTDVLASASEDFTIRLWNLHPDAELQPCFAVFAGDGHRQPVLACSFHPSGHWLISGGMDSAVALWAVPKPPAVDVTTSKDQEPTIIFHPHFYSAEVHDNLVDCLEFYGNVLISRCSKEQGEDQNDILIWQIDNFDGNVSAKDLAAPVSTPDRYTRSAFTTDSMALGFRRLLTLDMPGTDRFYLRFGLYHVPDRRPLICMGNQNSTMCFWDLQLLEEDLERASGASKDTSSHHDDSEDKEVANGTLMRKSQFKTPFKPIKPHHQVKVQPVDIDRFTASTTSWSPNGHWMIVVGDHNNMFVLYRDDRG